MAVIIHHMTPHHIGSRGRRGGGMGALHHPSLPLRRLESARATHPGDFCLTPTFLLRGFWTFNRRLASPSTSPMIQPTFPKLYITLKKKRKNGGEVTCLRVKFFLHRGNICVFQKFTRFYTVKKMLYLFWVWN